MHWRACMNHIYRVIYNQHTATYQAVPEISKGAHKTHSEHMVDGTLTPFSQSNVSFFRTVFTTLAMLIANLGMQQYVYAAPTGGQVVAGQANITQAGAVTNIHQSSQNAAINWQQFNIKPTETVNFKQPNAQAVTLNRVIGNEKSVIDGAMNANGKVFITNPNGTIIGKNAQINVGGLVATTANISNDDFMNGRYQFHGGSQGAIENLGQITVPEGGVVALIAPIVKNGGTITAPKANVLLASAERFSITLPDNQNFAYTLDQGTLQGLVDNGGAILADGGHVVLTAKGIDTVKKSLIKHSGVIEANIVQNKNGVIELLGDLDNTRLEVSGTLKAEAKVQGDGGFIETSASQLDISEQANISTQAKNGKTGTWLIDPKDFTVAPSGGDTTGAVVSKGLAQNNVTLKSRGGAKEGKGDVVINDEISWNKNTLTLNAENDIHINKTLNGSGTAKLALEYGQGTTDGGESDYHLSSHINLPKGNRFSLRKGYNGEIYKFFVIHEMPNITISGEGHRPGSELSEQFVALGNNIDLSITKDFPNFTGWKIPNGAKIHGLGHKLYNLSIKTDETSSEYLGSGLFQILENGELRDIGIDNVDINNSGEGLYAGGLVGYAKNSIIRNSYATGSISTTGYESEAGGLIGIIHDSEVKNSYAHSTVSTSGETAEAGGLVGYDIGGSSIINSYAAGKVSTKDSEKGGLIGYSNSGDYAQFNMGTYYDKDLLNSTSNSYGSEKSSVEMKQKSTFKDWDFDTVWRIDEGNDYPRLRALTEGTIIITPNKTDVGVQAHDLKKVYDGKEVSTEEHLRTIATANGYSDIVSVSGLKDGDSLSSLGGLTYGGTWQGAKNAGKYSIVPSGLNGGQKYEIKYGEGSLTIDKRPVTLNLSGEKIYDGTNTISVLEKANTTNQQGILDSELNKITFNGSGSLTGTNVGTHQLQSISENVIVGDLGKNYEIRQIGGQWKINKKPIAITATRIYDGTNNAISEEIDNNTIISDLKNKLVTADKNKLSNNNAVVIVGQGALLTKNAGSKIAVSDAGTLKLFALTPVDKAIMNNYELDLKNSYWEIKPADLIVTAVSDKKVYDGTQNSNQKPIISGLKGNDTAEFRQRFDDRNVWGENQSEISITNGRITDGNNGNNYSIFIQKAKGTIEPRELRLVGKAKDIESPANIDSLKGCMIMCYDADIDIDSLELIGLQGNDTIDVTINSTKYFDKPYAGDDKRVSVDWSISGQYARNYIASGSDITGRITPRTFAGKSLCFLASACGMRTDTMSEINEHAENYLHIMYFSTRKFDLSTQLKGFISSNYSEKAKDDADFKNHPFLSIALWGVALLGDGASTVGNVVSYPVTFVKGQISTGINETKKVKGLSKQQADSYEKIAHLTVDLINIYYSIASPKDVDLTGTYEQANERFTTHLAEQTSKQLEEFSKHISSFPPEQQQALLSNPLIQKVLSGSFKANESAATEQIIADSLGLINDLIQAGVNIDEILSQNE